MPSQFLIGKIVISFIVIYSGDNLVEHSLVHIKIIFCTMLNAARLKFRLKILE